MAIIYGNGFDESQASTIINGVPCGEYVRDYQENCDVQAGESLTKTYMCEWSKRFIVANAMLGLVRVSGGSGGTVQFNPPLQHPEIPSCFCGNVSIKGVGMPFQGPNQLAFPTAMITVGFRNFPWNFSGADDPEHLQDIDPNTPFIYATQEIDQGEESVEFGAGALKIQRGTGAAIVLQKPRSIPIRHVIMRITFNKMPYLPVQTLPYYNHTNSSTFLGCPKGTVRFKGTQTRRTFQLDSQGTDSASQDCTNTYEFRQIKDWNYIPDPTGSANWALLSYSDGTLLYPYDDLSQTFPQDYLSS